MDLERQHGPSIDADAQFKRALSAPQHKTEKSSCVNTKGISPAESCSVSRVGWRNLTLDGREGGRYPGLGGGGDTFLGLGGGYLPLVGRYPPSAGR